MVWWLQAASIITSMMMQIPTVRTTYWQAMHAWACTHHFQAHSWPLHVLTLLALRAIIYELWCSFSNKLFLTHSRKEEKGGDVCEGVRGGDDDIHRWEPPDHWMKEPASMWRRMVGERRGMEEKKGEAQDFSICIIDAFPAAKLK
ncbi:uncharacterized protein LOC120272439 [Dioscorea cayenensis subsp. rotundata]|uniref:Uncharacterized protein LOC120272439 n=1 Tax=Dioscorea cayennensis subsp. rotundata TaxID=55577 RepID=A0AB40C8S8_DIOCR|nr:uncharacterized protein LOC120272439 [Dioscorea cayenensis subsp. rotundata]